MSDIVEKTVIITGASRGIGEAIARHFAAQGARVILAARSETALHSMAKDIEQAGGKASAFACDVSDYSSVAALVDYAVQTYGSLDILVNNAGLIEPIARLAESDPAEWGRITDINYKGVYHGLRAALPVMVAGGGGTILNLSSGAATSALEGWSHYCSSKAAVLSLTACANKEYREKGVRVVGLSPGTVATEMQMAIRASGLNPVSKIDPNAHIPAEWVARAAAYLCGPEGDAYAGTDFSLKTAEGRAKLGLPSP